MPLLAIPVLTAIGTAAAVGSTAYGIYSGQKQAGMQKQALTRQNQAQQEARSAALSTERNAEVAQNAANQKTPDIATILQRAQAMANQGVSSTMLTGPTGVNTTDLSLGKATLLGA